MDMSSWVPFRLGGFVLCWGPFLGLGLSIVGGMISSGICDRWDDFNFGMVGFPFLDEGVPRARSCGVCVSQPIRFARLFSNVGDFNDGGLLLAPGLLRRGCRWHKLLEAISRFCRRHSWLIIIYNVHLLGKG